MIRAVIFDWGGVLIDDPDPQMVTYFSKYFKIPEEEVRKAKKRYEPDFQKGIISEDVLWEGVCSELGVPRPSVPSLWGDAFRHAYLEKKETFSLASLLRKKGYKIGFLSNTEVPAMNFFKARHYAFFDAAVFSCAENTRKPEEKIYKIALERLGVRPAESVFIDDKKDYVEGAKKVGINAILFLSPAQVKKELSALVNL